MTLLYLCFAVTLGCALATLRKLTKRTTLPLANARAPWWKRLGAGARARARAITTYELGPVRTCEITGEPYRAVRVAEAEDRRVLEELARECRYERDDIARRVIGWPSKISAPRIMNDVV